MSNVVDKEMIKVVYDALDDKKGIDIKVLDISRISVMADYFIIATGNSDKQVQAFSDFVEETMDKEGKDFINKEGYNTAEWILLGYEDIIVHIFQKETREFYAIEHIWKDAPEVDITDLLID